MTVFGYYLILAYIFPILFLGFLLSFSFDREDILNTQDGVCHHFQTPQGSINKTHPTCRNRVAKRAQYVGLECCDRVAGALNSLLSNPTVY